MTNTAQPAQSLHRNVVPSEVGWQFVPQYYTFVNKQPDRLHCFYTKRSTFIHGTEGEDGKPCHGQQEIHQKITSLGFQDCKVFIHSVDAQSSADGGIIIQVIGEMSNRGEDWKKFVQTFFLAEQPNGYFVLNDIFRFLKEEAVEDEHVEESPATTEPVSPEPVVIEAAQPEPAPAPVISYIAPESPAPVPEPVPIEEPTTVAELPEPERPVTPEPVAGARINGTSHTQEPEKPRVVTPTPAPPSPAPPVEKSRSPAPPPAASATPPPQQPAAPPAPAQTQAPATSRPAPKTWANLAAANPKKWGSAVAQESRGTTEVIPPSQANAAQPSQAPVQAAVPTTPTGNGSRPHQALINAQTISTAQCFIKGVVEGVSQQTLTQVLTSRFGPLKELEIVRNKACAFGEFTTIEAARKAIIASLYPAQGGEGGIWVDLIEGGQTRIIVDTKKERGERPPSRPRGGAPPQGGGPQGGNVNTGGSFRGRGRGRGGPPAK